MPKTRRALLAGVLVLPAPFADAATITWTGAGDGVSWNSGANWAGGLVPGPADDAVLPPGPPVALAFNVQAAVRSVNALRTIQLANWAGLACSADSHVTDLLIAQNARVDAAAGAELVIAGVATSDYGTLGGPGRKTIAGRYESATTMYLEGLVRNDGRITFERVLTLTGCTLTNGPAGVLASSPGAPGQQSVIVRGGGGPSRIINQGSIVKDQDPEWICQVDVENSGVFSASRGAAGFFGAMTLAAPLNIGPQATVTLGGALSAPAGVTALTGSGRLILAGAVGAVDGQVAFTGRLSTQYSSTNVSFAGPVTLGALDPVAGTLRFASTLSGPHDLTLANFGRVDFDAPQAFDRITMADASTLGGAGDITVRVALACESATLTGPGRLILEAGSTATFSGSTFLGKPLVNRGTMIPARGLTFTTPTVNEGLIVVDVPDQQVARLSQQGLPPGAVGLTNLGEIRKQGPGRLIIDALFANVGLLDDRAGAVEIQSTANMAGRTLRGGAWRIAGNGSLEFPYNLQPGAPLLELDADDAGRPARLLLDGPLAVFDPRNQSPQGPADTRWQIGLIGPGCEIGVSGGATVTLWPLAVLVNDGQQQHLEARPVDVRGTLSADTASHLQIPSWLNLAPTAAVHVTYAGPGPAPITVSGVEFNSRCRLDGTLRVRYAPGYVPPANAPESTLLAHFFDPIAGCFAAYDLPPSSRARCLGDPDNAVRFAPICPGDFNQDGFLDFFDYGDYVECFETGVCPPGVTADFNGDGFADFFDYGDFVDAFEAGC